MYQDFSVDFVAIVNRLSFSGWQGHCKISMLITDKFSSNTIEEIAKILGETLTGGEIARFLRESNITEIDCLSTTKWRRLNASFLGSQISLQNASAICSCIENILSPIRFVSRQDNFEEYQKQLMLY